MLDTLAAAESHVTFDILQWMDKESGIIFKSHTKSIKYKANKIIFMQGDPGNEMFRIINGWVKFVSNSPDGREFILMHYEPGDCFGGAGLIDGGARPQSAEALTDVELEVLDRSSYMRLREQCSAFDGALLKLLARELTFVSTRYAHASLCPLSARVASRIINVAPLFTPRHSDTENMTIPLSQSELASMTCSTRQSVNKILSIFQSENILRVEYSNITILDINRLREHAMRLY